VILVAGKAGWIGTGSVRTLFDAGVWGLALVFALRAVGDLRTYSCFLEGYSHALCAVRHVALFAALLADCAVGRLFGPVAPMTLI